MATTINGKALKDCMKELQSYKDTKDKKLGRYPYYKIKDYYDRVNAVFGMEHYSVSYQEVGHVGVISSGQEFITVKCSLEITDDEFRPIIKREGYGSREITFNDSGKEVNIHNLYRIASQLAFKATWDQLNIFGKSYDTCEAYEDRPRQEVENQKVSLSKPQVQQEQIPASKSEEKAPAVENQYYWMRTSGKMVVERTENTGKPVYSLLGENKVGAKCKLIFYPNQYHNWEDKINQLVSLCERGFTTFQFKASSSGKKGELEQLVFKGFA